MAGYVFVPYSAQGHVNPMLPVVAEMVARGERVRVVVGRRFAGRVAESGALSVVPPLDHEVRVPAQWGVVELVDRVRLRARRRSAWRAAVHRCVDEFRGDRPDVVVADPMAPWAGRLARRLNVPVVHFCTTHVRSPVGAGRVLVNCLPELQPHRQCFGARFQFVGPLIASENAEAADLPWDLVGRGPLLLVSPGTVFARTVGFFRAVVEDFANTGWVVLMATGHTPVAALGRLPDNVVARAWLPQQRLLPYATVFLTHGGMNSVQEALVHGVPMLLAPRSREQRLTADRIVELGLGRRLTRFVRPAVEKLAGDSRVLAAQYAMRDRLRQLCGAALAADALLRSAELNWRC